MIVSRSRSAPGDGDSGVADPEAVTCAHLLDAIVATVEERPDAPARVARLDALLRTGPPTPYSPHHPFVALARLHDLHGNTERALAAVRSRIVWSPESLHHLGTMLQEEARLAAEVGDTAGAMEADRH